MTIDDIAAGAVCNVTETSMPDAPAGFHWGDPTVSENPATIKDDDTVWVHFVNHLIPDGSLTITKDVTGAPEGYTGSFDVHVDCGNDGTFDKTIDFPTPGSVTIDNLKAGAVCAVTETGMPDAPAGLVFGEPDITGSPATIVSDDTAQRHGHQPSHRRPAGSRQPQGHQEHPGRSGRLHGQLRRPRHVHGRRSDQRDHLLPGPGLRHHRRPPGRRRVRRARDEPE